MKKLGLYIHIPFCVKKCRYCDFLSFGGNNCDLHLPYVEALKTEIGSASYDDFTVDSIYIGGGTPSLMPPDAIGGIIDKIYSIFSIDTNAEITIEANPNTLTRGKLSEYINYGINRISIGVQSLDDSLLNTLGRIHKADDFYESYEFARSAGFKNINVDLMFAIPGQTLEQWMSTVNKIIEMRPEHISFYSLQLEEGTLFYRMFEEGTLDYIDDETDREMYHMAIAGLKNNGYIHYEISNASKPGCNCRHNLKYWSMDEYLGFGLGAHSYINNIRTSNEVNIDSYIETAEKYAIKTAHGMKKLQSPFIIWKHQNTRKDEISEYIFTGMRRIEGISLSDFEKRFGISLLDIYEKEVRSHIMNGLLEMDEYKKRLKFTGKGIDLSNTVLVDFV